MRSTSSSVTDSGRRKRGIWVRIMPPPLASPSNITQSIAERHQIARHGQRGRTGADQRDALAVLLRRRLRQIAADIALVVGGDALQPADRDRLVLDPAAAAGRLARAVAGAPENAGKDVRFPVDRPGLAEPAVGDQADIFRHRRVRRAGPLAIDNFMEVVGITDVGGLQYASPAPTTELLAFCARIVSDAAAAPYTRTCGNRHPRVAALTHTGGYAQLASSVK